MIISVPLTDTSNPGGGPPKGGIYNKANFIPRCFMANAQLSFHGHRDAVKFFVSVPMSTAIQTPVVPTSGAPYLENPLLLGKMPDLLVISGGEGYIDFRLGKTAFLFHIYSDLDEYFVTGSCSYKFQ